MAKAAWIAITCWLLLLVFGCATKPSPKLPKPEAFSKDLSSLMAEYPDLTNYPSIFVLGARISDAAPFKEAWQEPHDKRLSWRLLYGGPDFSTLGCPPPFFWIGRFYKIWTWEFENKAVTALIEYPLALGYRPCVCRLTVAEKP